MCDIDGGYDSNLDLDTSEGIDLDISSDVDVESSFDELSDVTDFGEDTESIYEGIDSDGTDGSFEAVNDYPSLDSIDDVDGLDGFDFLQEEFEEEALTNPNGETLEETDGTEEEIDMNADELMAEQSQFGIDELEMAEALELQEEMSDAEDGPKVLTREITEDVLESRARDTEETLNNYRENLQERGVGENQIEEYINQEREKIEAEYESLDRGETSSNIYYMPTDWDAVAESLLGQENNLQEDISEAEHSDFDLNDEMFEEAEDILEENGEETDEISLTDLPDIEELEDVSEDETSEMHEEELSELNNTEDDYIEESLDDEPDIMEENEEDSLIEPIEDVDEDAEEISEIQETDIDYDEIYEGMQQEALEQGFEDIDILTDEERLDNSLENFEAANWENLTLDDQKESLSDLAEYVEEVIGFERPPQIEYYYNPREGDYGGYNSATNTLRVNEYMLYNSSEAADTIAHELWHAHQRECADNPRSERDYQYQYNFENYIKPEFGQREYENQLIEAEARAFAAQFKGRLASLSGRVR